MTILMMKMTKMLLMTVRMRRGRKPSVKALSLPQAEQAKLRAMEELEDERLERCRSTAAFEFDQCFFFGPRDPAAARRPMEGAGALIRRHTYCMLIMHYQVDMMLWCHLMIYVAGSLRLAPSARERGQSAARPLPPEEGPRKVPTW